MVSTLFVLVSLTVFVGLGFFISPVNGHGRTIIPTSRMTRMRNNCGDVRVWLYGDEYTVGRAQSVNPGFECGVCGDDIKLPQSSRIHELANPNMKAIATNISANSLLEVAVVIEFYHKGIIQWRLCCNQTQERDSNIIIAQGCFNRNLLQVISSNSSIPGAIRPGIDCVTFLYDDQEPIDPPIVITAQLKLPKNLESDTCTLQMNYRTDHDAEVQANETFRSCSNLKIFPDSKSTNLNKQSTFLKNRKFGHCLTPNWKSKAFHDIYSFTTTLDKCGTGNESSPSPQSFVELQLWEDYNTQANILLFESSGSCLVADWTKTYSHPLVTRCNEASTLWETKTVGERWVQLRNLDNGRCLSATSYEWISLQNCRKDDVAQQWEIFTLSV